MTRKPVIIALLAATFAAAVPVAVPVAAMANPDFHGRYARDCRRAAPCESMPRLTEEQRAQMVKLHEEHRAAVAPLREQIAEKRMTLNALSRNPNTSPDELRALTADISRLRAKMRTVNDDFRAKMQKQGLPCAEFGRHDGYGPRHHDGYGHRYHDNCRI
ncbi:periplasmic heavy metal sensor [Mailhella massiliensis]|uniref:periplasmic heavy metal sensor n=1 Tax=Mailhella massiliensis TaxID=1903261 RepID=UPI002352749B|nr:periplasmic heavy metal sensor [Mailhella massiliensis]